MASDFTRIAIPTHAHIKQATVSLADMGSNTIQAQVEFTDSSAPDFSYDWVLAFRGEKYIYPYKKPQASKDNTSWHSQMDLTFVHWPEYQLKRYYFAEMASVGAGTYIPNRFDASLSLNLIGFVTALNEVLKYWYGDAIRADLNPDFSFDLEPTLVSISNSYIWDVIQNLYELYAVRWKIITDPTDSDKYIIRIGYPSEEIDHIFEYGFNGGLLKFEQQVQSPDIRNILLGRGGEKNLPYRYFKKHDEDNENFEPDPDYIPELEDVYFDGLRDINFRYYVQGWKDKHYNYDSATGEISDLGDHTTGTRRYAAELHWAYDMGFTDEKFNPVEYVKDDASILKFGQLWGGLDKNEDIYPSIQGVTVDPNGRIDEVVSVEQIESDDVESTTQTESIQYTIPDFNGSDRPKAYSNWYDISARSETFRVAQGMYATLISQVPSLTAIYPKLSWVVENGIAKQVVDGYVDVAQDKLFLEDVTFEVWNATTNSKYEGSISSIESGWYYIVAKGKYKIETLDINLEAQPVDATMSINNVVFEIGDGTDSRKWNQVFDIWIKDIWGSVRNTGETDTAFAERVWRPILGSADGGEASVVFSTGLLAASEDYEFKIIDYAYDNSKTLYEFNDGTTSDSNEFAGAHGGIAHEYPSMWRLNLAKSDADLETLGIYVPSVERQGVAGDHFFFIGIDMPHMYVLKAEERLNAYKTDELDKIKDIKPSRTITLDKVRCQTKLGSESQTFIDKFKVGDTFRISNSQYITESPYDETYIGAITYTYNSDSLIPEMEITLQTEPTTNKSSVTMLRSEVSSLQKQIGAISSIESVVRAIGDKLYLRKDGVSDRSLSPSEFYGLVSSEKFRQGRIGGNGWGIYRDGNGNTVFEADRMILRQDLDVTNLLIHQTEWVGGTYIESAAGMECTNVDDTATGYKCYFDQKQGTVPNMFQVGDVAYCHRYDPAAGSSNIIKFYKRKVVEVGNGYITLSKTIRNGEGIPAGGDKIVQYGNYTNTNRQYVKIRDVVGGGYERFLEGLNSVTAAGTEYYYAGKEISSSGSLTSYRLFIGNKSNDYLEWKDGQLNIRGKLIIQGSNQSVTDYVDSRVSSEETARQAQIDALQAQIDGVVEAWSGEGEPTTENYPASSWTTDVERQKHNGDVYTDNETGYAYRWYWYSATEYGWTQIGDTAAAEALNLAKQSVIDVDVLYQSTTSQETAPALPPASGWQTDAPQWQLGYYIWTTTKTTYGDGTITYSDPVMISGKNGEDGTKVTITSQSVTYQTSASGTTTPTGTWYPTVQATTDAKPFLWTRTIVNYSPSGSTTAYSVSYKGTNGTNVTITSASTKYAPLQTSSSQPSDSAFTLTSVPSLIPNRYLWSMTTVEYSNGSSTKSYAASRIGQDGEQGIPGKPGSNGQTSYLHIAYANSADGTVDFSTSNGNDKLYIGQYTDFTLADSTNPSDYTWTLIKGASQHYNLFTGTGKYRENTPIIDTSSNKDGYFYHTDIVAKFEGSKTVTVQCKTDGVWGTHITDGTAPSSNVLIWLIGSTSDTNLAANYHQALTASMMKSDGVWTVTLPSGYKAWYIRTNIYSDGSTSVTHRFWDIKMEEGETASDWCMAEEEYIGNGIESIVEMYYLSTSNTALQGGSWKTAENKDPWVAGKYYWTKSVITYTDGTSVETEPICVTGSAGASAVLLDLTNENVSIPCDVIGNPLIGLSTITTTAKVYEGASVASGWTLSKSDNGCTTSLSNGVLTLTALSADKATVTVTATKSGSATLTAVWNISKVKAGGDGTNLNLLDGTKDWSGNWLSDSALWETDSELYNGFVVKKQTLLWRGLYKQYYGIAGEYYTFSAWVKTSANCNVGIYVTEGATHLADSTPNQKTFSLVANTWTRVSLTFKWLDSSRPICARIESSSNSTATIYVAAYMLEKGKVASDWNVSAADLQPIVYSIETSVDNITKSFDGTLSTNTITAYKYKTTGTAGRVQTTDNVLKYQRVGVDSSEITLGGYGGSISVTSATESIIVTLYDANTGDVLDRERVPVLVDASDMEFAPINYALKTIYPVSVPASKFTTGSSSKGLYQATGLKTGDVCTLSFDVEIDSVTVDGAVSITTNSTYGMITIGSITSSGHYEFHFTMPPKSTVNNITQNIVTTDKGAFFVNIYNASTTSSNPMKFSKFTLNKGTIPIEWQPNPNDTSYLTDALKESTTIDGGLIQTSVVQTGYTDGGTFNPMSGMNGIYDANGTGGGMAFVAGGDFVDPVDVANGTVTGKSATFGVRMDGTVWAANNTVRIGKSSIDVGDFITLNGSGMSMLGTDGTNVFNLTNLEISESDLREITSVNVNLSRTIAVSLRMLYNSGSHSYYQTNSSSSSSYTVFNSSYSVPSKTQLTLNESTITIPSAMYSNDSDDIQSMVVLPRVYLQITSSSGFSKIIDLQSGLPTSPTSYTNNWGACTVPYKLSPQTINIAETGGTVTFKLFIVAQRSPSSVAYSTTSTCSYSVTGKFSSSPVSKSTIGLNGISSIWPNGGMIIIPSLFEVIQGNYGFRVSPAGIQYSTQSGADGTWQSLI